MDVKDWQRVIEDFWWEHYRKVHRNMNNRTREEIESLAKVIDKKHREHIRANYDDDV